MRAFKQSLSVAVNQCYSGALIGGSMGNRATISTEKRSRHENSTKQANHLVRKAAQTIEPRGCNYVGSAVIHYFTKPSSSSKFDVEQTTEFVIVTQVLLDKVEEGFADFGWKQLQKDLMAFFGRKAPATRSKGGIIIP